MAGSVRWVVTPGRFGGEGGIRTLEGVAPLRHFQCRALDRTRRPLRPRGRESTQRRGGGLAASGGAQNGTDLTSRTAPPSGATAYTSAIGKPVVDGTDGSCRATASRWPPGSGSAPASARPAGALHTTVPSLQRTTETWRSAGVAPPVLTTASEPSHENASTLPSRCATATPFASEMVAVVRVRSPRISATYRPSREAAAPVMVSPAVYVRDHSVRPVVRSTTQRWENAEPGGPPWLITARPPSTLQ